MTIIIISLLLLVSLPSHLTLTVNGNEATPHSRPYMVSVQFNDDHFCGGFLISEEFVFTAAYCRKSSDEKLTVVVGAHDLKNKEEGSVRIRVKSCHTHPHFVQKTLQNDIMLLRLERKIKLSQTVHMTSLPKQKEDTKAGTLCSVFGWGRQYTNGPLSDRLLETEVKTIENKQCLKLWNKRDDIKVKYSVSKMMCVYGHGGSCEGDSGGPLVCEDTVVGIMSFGNPHLCNSHLFPNVYTKISAHHDWIWKTINKQK
ncbi:granzyme-like protein [Danio aesculapii]|uniref:granzyme-like protein n=1 Tax=Danio aesculapii TaxID=1142201 RepID=UPI0024C0DA18|nr:granzyme-like protein [Danio aesculapii]